MERKKEKKKEKEEKSFSVADIELIKEKKRASETVIKILDQTIQGKKIDEQILEATKPIDYTKIAETKAEDELKKLREQFIEDLPRWVNAPWMFITPKKDSQLKSWLEDWSTVLLDYAQIFNFHVVNINELRNVHPFNNRKIGKKLSLEQLRQIVDYLIEQNFARWLDEQRKTRARIYWKSLEEWADEMLDFLIDTGRIVEIHSLYDLTTFEQKWSTLPPEELVAVCQILVDRGVARWLNKEKTIIDYIEEQVY